jgi:hypothetical protein
MVPALCDLALTIIGISTQKSTRTTLAACAIAGMLAVSGCGGDEEEPAPSASETATTPTATAETPTETEQEPEQPPAEETETVTTPVVPPEEQEGGAGDEEPARTLALFTARDGRIRPRVIRVPAFISIQVELRSADGSAYGLRFGDVTIRAGGELNSTSRTIDGLRPGEAITGRPTGAGNPVRVEATAEPGP